MIIASILLLLIDGINCLKNGVPINRASAYTNFAATIWQYEFTAPRYLCSGTIITLDHIVTAGHCVRNVKNYEIYVTAGRIDLDSMMSVMVHQIYLHQNFRNAPNPADPRTQYWLNDIAILHLVYRLSPEFHVTPSPRYSRKWSHVVEDNCYVLGWNNIAEGVTSSVTLQVVQAAILGEDCRLPNALLLPNEVHAFLKSIPATLEDTDIGNSLMCNNRAIGIIVRNGGEQPHNSFTVLPFVPYKSFIQYIQDGGVTSIGTRGFRGVVTIWESDNLRCGGFIVDKRYVVTAAHCVKDIKAANLLVAYSFVSSPVMNSEFKKLPVEKIEIHPLYESTYNPNLREYSVENDIAVLRLALDLSGYPHIRLGVLPDPRLISIDTPFEMYRWTPPNAAASVSKSLMKSFVTILNTQRQGELSYHVGANQFLAEGVYALPIATNQDIGNPIIFGRKIIGLIVTVASYPDPVICLQIQPYKNFIRNIIANR